MRTAISLLLTLSSVAYAAESPRCLATLQQRYCSSIILSRFSRSQPTMNEFSFLQHCNESTSQDCPFRRPTHSGGPPSIGQMFLWLSHLAMTRKINNSQERVALFAIGVDCSYSPDMLVSGTKLYL
jgi:hypothetical protein